MKKVGEADYILAWVVFGFCTVGGVFLIGAVGGFFLGLVMRLMDASPEQIKLAVTVAGVLIWLPVSYVMYRFVTKAMLVEKAERRVLSPPPLPSASVPAVPALPEPRGGVPPPLVIPSGTILRDWSLPQGKVEPEPSPQEEESGELPPGPRV